MNEEPPRGYRTAPGSAPPVRRQFASTIFLLNPPREFLWAAAAAAAAAARRQENGQQSDFVEQQRQQELFEQQKQQQTSQKQFEYKQQQIIEQLIDRNQQIKFDQQQQLIMNQLPVDQQDYGSQQIVDKQKAEDQPDQQQHYDQQQQQQMETVFQKQQYSDEQKIDSLVFEAQKQEKLSSAWSGDSSIVTGTELATVAKAATVARRQLVDALQRALSRQPRAGRRRCASDNKNNNNNKRDNCDNNKVITVAGGTSFRFRIPAVLASPRLVMTSPLRGLRRAALSASSINCCPPCTSASSATAADPFGCAHVLLQAATAVTGGANGHVYPYPRSHTPFMVLPSRTGSTTVYSSASQTSLILLSNNSRCGSHYGSREGSLYGDDSNLANQLSYLSDDYGGVDQSVTTTSEDYSSPTAGNYSSSIGNEEPHIQPFYNFAARPPLNRAIPPIPESKSNESIISVANILRAAVAAANVAQSSSDTKSDNNNNDTDTDTDNKSITNLEKKKEAVKVAEMPPAASPTSPKGRSRRRQDDETAAPAATSKPKSTPTAPKSPLTSMANVVRTRFSKLGTRLGRVQSPGRSVGLRASQSFQPSVQGQRASSRSSLPKSASAEARDVPPRIKIASSGWYTTNVTAVPRRLPTATLLPSLASARLPTRLPFDDLPLPAPAPISKYAPPSVPVPAERRAVHFAAEDETNISATVVLERVEELPFIWLEKTITPAAVTVDEPLRNIDDESLLLDDSPVYYTAATPLVNALSARQGRVAPSGSDLWQMRATATAHTTVVTNIVGLRKAPLSFPPMPAAAADSGQRQRQPPRSLSIGAADRTSPVESKRRAIFSTRSLRHAASRLAEASPRATSEAPRLTRCDADEPSTSSAPDATFGASTVTRQKRKRAVFRKSVSLPESKAPPATGGRRTKKKENLRRERAASFAQRDQPAEINSIRAVWLKRSSARAPLAEIESSRVAENSPAVEWLPNFFRRPSPLNSDNKLTTTTTKTVANCYAALQPSEPQPTNTLVSPVEILFACEPPPPPPSSDLSTGGRLDENNNDSKQQNNNNYYDNNNLTYCNGSSSLSETAYSNRIPSIYDISSTVSGSRSPLATATVTSKPSRIARWNWGKKQQPKDNKPATTKKTKNSNNKEATVAMASGNAPPLTRRMERLRLGDALQPQPQIRPSATSKQQSHNSPTHHRPVTTTARKTPLNTVATQQKPTSRPAASGANASGWEVKSVDDVELSMAASDADVLAIPEMLAEFKRQLSSLQSEIHNDYAEIERLKAENEELQKKLKSRDAIIEALRQRLESAGKS